ncbi:hypothetical protein [Parafrankia sp. FMc2]|uniref:hypothetical protein n=1 Tax=Parafrankia sp. FMc2 TaxID=3233196 RepID=UPI0034D4A35D
MDYDSQPPEQGNDNTGPEFRDTAPRTFTVRSHELVRRAAIGKLGHYIAQRHT